MIFRTTPTFSAQYWFAGRKRDKKGETLVPHSNISYKTIKSNKTLFDCVGKESFDVEEENEEEAQK